MRKLLAAVVTVFVLAAAAAILAPRSGEGANQIGTWTKPMDNLPEVVQTLIFSTTTRTPGLVGAATAQSQTAASTTPIVLASTGAPGSVLYANGVALKATCSGIFSPTLGVNKTVALWVGGVGGPQANGAPVTVAISSSTASHVSEPYQIEAVLTRAGPSSSYVYGRVYQANSASQVTVTRAQNSTFVFTAAPASTLVFSCIGINGTANAADIINDLLSLEIIQ